MPESKYPRSWRRLRPIAYALKVKQDGELCKRCHKHPVKEGQSISDPASQCKRLDVDHIDNDKQNNPETGENWQLLCHPCNIALGLFLDNPETCRAAAEYLEDWA